MPRIQSITASLKRIPATIAGDAYAQRFLRLMIAGLLLRVVLMPFGGHIDVLSEARRVYYWVQNDLFFDMTSRNITFLIQSLSLRLLLPLLPDADAMFAWQGLAGTTASVQNSFEFVSHATIFRTLFVLKIPYLVCDLLTAFILFRFFHNKENALRSCKVWLFNPITLFAFYVFGRFEAIPLFFLAAALFSAQRGRIVWSAVFFACCLNARAMMNLFLPIYLLALVSIERGEFTLFKRLAALGIVALAGAVALQIPSFFIDIKDVSGEAVESVMKEGRVVHLFAFQIHGVILIVLVYALVLIWVWNSRHPFFEKLLLGGTLSIFSFFAFSSHTAHFTAWMMLFPAVYIGRDKGLVKPFIALCLAWVGLWSFLTDLGVFTLWLLAPFSLYFTAVPNVPAIFLFLNEAMGLFDLKLVINIFRTLFIAGLFYLAFNILRPYWSGNR
jgi:hypothetical protein